MARLKQPLRVHYGQEPGIAFCNGQNNIGDISKLQITDNLELVTCGTCKRLKYMRENKELYGK